MIALVLVSLSILSVGLWFWAMLDMAIRHFKDPSDRSVWILIVLLFPVLGSVFYFQLRNQLTTEEGRKFQPKFKRH
ncbi:MAG: PLD nuclease N-terminal domain-containing protein [Gelidibacter sp.]